MWLHEGHIAAIKNFPQLLFTSQWQLFDIAVNSRQEGYKVCLDDETVTDNDDLKFLNNKGLVERDHKTKKDPFYLYKAWWNTTDKFVHICQKNFTKVTDRVIKCYTNETGNFSLYVNPTGENDTPIETITPTNNILEFTATTFNAGDVIVVTNGTVSDTFTFEL
jgi:beta-galactosidase